MPHIKRMVIDEEGKHILTNYKKVKSVEKASNTDHATIYVDLDLKIETEKPKRRLIWNLKNKKAQQILKVSTSKTTDFTECFDNKLPLETQI